MSDGSREPATRQPATRQPTGILVMAHGTPSDPAAIEPFYTSIRRGRPPTPELLADLVARYEAIGGTSPLAERTRAQVEGIAAVLEAVAPGEYLVRYGAKHTSPTIEEAVAELIGSGVERIVAIVLTPHQSSLGSGEYFRRALDATALASDPVPLTPILSWHRTPGLASLLADRTRDALATLPSSGADRGGPTMVFFTAHSLPSWVVAEGDPYPDQVAESAADIAQLLGLDDRPDLSWGVAWQSAGRTPDPWIGPDLLLEIRRVAEEGAASIVVCPVGFVSDHLEILYDLDIEALDVARSAGVDLVRTRSLNDDPRFLGLLAGVVQDAARDGAPAATPAVTRSAPPACERAACRLTIAVIGAGIAGLAAAWEIVVASEREGRPVPAVHVLESSGRIGGKLRAAEFAGRTVDLAADAFLARRPEATELCDELGLTDQLVPVGASGASIWARGRLRPMPDGLNLGVPTRWWPLFRSGILSPAESMRVARDLITPHWGGNAAFGDRPVGDIVGERLGRPVVERLVDPLIGGINAGGVDDLSAAATMPVLIAASHQTGSLMHRLGRVPGGPRSSPAPDAASPVFWSLAGSTASLAGQLADELVRRGVTIQTALRVDAIDRRPSSRSEPGRWTLSLHDADGHDDGTSDDGTSDKGTSDKGTSDKGTHGNSTHAHAAGVPDRRHPLDVDGVVLAVPATEAAVLLAPHAPMAAGVLSTIDYASVAVVTLTVADGSIGAPLRGTGFLVPRTSTIDGRPALITGCTYLDRKWPRLRGADDVLIRASVGRFGDNRHLELDDDELRASAFGELADLLDIRGAPLDAVVTRWDRAFPQYQVGHLIKVAKVEEEVAGVRGLAVAGSALRGAGIPVCIASGRNAGRLVLDSVTGGPGPRVPRPDASEAGT